MLQNSKLSALFDVNLLYKQELEAAVQKHALQSSVTFKPNISDTERYRSYTYTHIAQYLLVTSAGLTLSQ
jgi:hypothetical protein